ncbi:FGGY-family pentulose kinase [Methylobacterium sp. 174MFSha1.1]|uniref:FGGY-family carbohydrate kinase n=1 Tax=Methylobacterium sp. 174MFSha1.1 TaxID=1502749 RepID=UPI0008EABBBF|nr:FGGY-family carbohydrate kinase [Methylobacterium sp. 174MFSha1.1]SFU76363.1 FGGY-family pentulose kinase [Methylobacterium sp. 174MFSha1.1]
MRSPLVLAVDVGTLSARAGLFTPDGRCVATRQAPFRLLRPAEHHAVYRMGEIWAAVGASVRDALAAEPGAAARVAGLAFDATSSLALTAAGAPPLDGEADVVCWMDHRGEAEALEIDRTGHRFLDHVGGAVSPETNLPKLLWLKRHRPEAWARLTAARDLCDELAFRATEIDRHSVCGLACKWPYLPNEAEPWCRDLLDALGLDDLTRLGTLAAAPAHVGAVHGPLCEEAARHLGLPPGLPVAVGLIDAEAGALGVLGRDCRTRLNRVLPMIAGTSTSFMPFAPDPRHVPGVWGPFKDAVFPGLWMHEAGQSLSGAALDAVLAHHPASPGPPTPERHAAAAAAVLARLDAEGPAFAARRHVVPDWLGNRAPLGDGRVRALLTGIGEETSERSFLEAYYATARALALQTRHIREHLNRHGYAIDTVALAGGHRHNPLLMRLYRDALGCTLVVGAAAEPVLLGTAMVAATAAGLVPDLFAALDAMAPEQAALTPDPAWARAHERAYRTYLTLFEVRNAVERDALCAEADLADDHG